MLSRLWQRSRARHKAGRRCPCAALPGPAGRAGLPAVPRAPPGPAPAVAERWRGGAAAPAGHPLPAPAAAARRAGRRRSAPPPPNFCRRSAAPRLLPGGEAGAVPSPRAAAGARGAPGFFPQLFIVFPPFFFFFPSPRGGVGKGRGYKARRDVRDTVPAAARLHRSGGLGQQPAPKKSTQASPPREGRDGTGRRKVRHGERGRPLSPLRLPRRGRGSRCPDPAAGPSAGAGPGPRPPRRRPCSRGCGAEPSSRHLSAAAFAGCCREKPRLSDPSVLSDPSLAFEVCFFLPGFALLQPGAAVCPAARAAAGKPGSSSGAAAEPVCARQAAAPAPPASFVLLGGKKVATKKEAGRKLYGGM